MFGAINGARVSSSMVKVMVLTVIFFEIKSGFFEDTLESHYGIASSLFVFRTPVARRLGGLPHRIYVIQDIAQCGIKALGRS